MNRNLLFTLLALLLIGGASLPFLLPSEEAELDDAGRELLARFSAAQQADPPFPTQDLEALVRQVRVHPFSRIDTGLLRADAWLSHELGQFGRAGEAMELVLGTEETVPQQRAADLALSARILMRLHAQSNDPETGGLAVTQAREAYATLGSPDLLLLAWVMSLRCGDAELRRPPEVAPGQGWGLAEAMAGGSSDWLKQAAEIARALAADHKDSPQQRLVAAMKGFPRQIDATQRGLLAALVTELTWAPEELDEVQALHKVASGAEADIAAGAALAAEVLKTRPASSSARFAAGLGAFRLKKFTDAVFHLEYLVRTYPRHPDVDSWAKLLGHARQPR